MPDGDGDVLIRRAITRHIIVEHACQLREIGLQVITRRCQHEAGTITIDRPRQRVQLFLHHDHLALVERDPALKPSNPGRQLNLGSDLLGFGLPNRDQQGPAAGTLVVEGVVQILAAALPDQTPEGSQI